MEIETPLLIPSLSTRNVGRIERTDSPGGEPQPIASAILEYMGNSLDESLLVSAFDLHYRRLHDSDRLLDKGEDLTAFHHPSFLMIDSGLYETRARVGYDDGYERPDDWSPRMYDRLLDAVPEHLDAAVANYDHDPEQLAQAGEEATFAAQIERARKFFADHERFARVMILKPERQYGFLEVDRLIAEARSLQEFDIIAVTEKELGNTLRDRFSNLALLSQRLLERNVDRPIHVFGGLDPLMTPLYIACGAEIVDGVGWLRYAYGPGDVANYLESRSVLECAVDDRVPNRLFLTISKNAGYLRLLKRRLEVLIEGEDWLKFSPERGDAMKKFYELVSTGVEVKA